MKKLLLIGCLTASTILGIYCQNFNPLPPVPCQYKISLFDSFGDGWNGCSLTVLVNGSPTNPPLTGITLTGGYGPADFYFEVATGAEITTTFSPSGYPCEPYYYIYNSLGQQVIYVPNNCNPVILPGQLYGSCPTQGDLQGHVIDCNGMDVIGALISTDFGQSTQSDNNGNYFLPGINAGFVSITCAHPDYTIAEANVQIITSQTVILNFYMTAPVMFIDPPALDVILAPNDNTSELLKIGNDGCSAFCWQAFINYFTGFCDYRIALYDSYGDGWNGNTLNLLVNGIVIQNIFLASGSGPENITFTVAPFDMITTNFIPGPPPNYIAEPYYYIYNENNQQIAYSPNTVNGPPDILPGDLMVATGCDDWSTLNDYACSFPIGDPFPSSVLIPVNFDASLTAPGGGVIGETYKAEIVFNTDPSFMTITIPITLTIADPTTPQVPGMDFFYMDADEGLVLLEWDTPPSRAMLHYIVFRNGQAVDTTASNSYIDHLEIPGQYCYKVSALSVDGHVSLPTEPVCLYYPFPPTIPLATWALVLAGIVMAAYTFMIIRKKH